MNSWGPTVCYLASESEHLISVPRYTQTLSQLPEMSAGPHITNKGRDVSVDVQDLATCDNSFVIPRECNVVNLLVQGRVPCLVSGRETSQEDKALVSHTAVSQRSPLMNSVRGLPVVGGGTATEERDREF